MANNSADQFFGKSTRAESRAGESTRTRQSRTRMPSSAGYIAAAVTVALALFFVLWWMLISGGDEAPWLPAGLAASVVLLVAFSAREIVMRRAWTRYLLEHGIQHSSGRHESTRTHKLSSSGYTAALRTIQKRSVTADSSLTTADAHLDVANLCLEYLAATDDALRSGTLGSEKKLALRSGQQQVKALHKHHLLTWARNQSRALTHEAQQKARMFEKVETANRAMDCIDSAIRHYPDEIELNQSRLAIAEFIASVKVAHWVELAERAAFKSQYRRAIERYRDALYYLGQDAIKEDVRTAGTRRIEGEIAKLQKALRSPQREKQASDQSEGQELGNNGLG